jgi:predicted flap endonuclease-1-like 5' DNA nuclease
MNNRNAKTELFLGSWGVAAAVGVLAAALLWVLGNWSFLQGAFMGFLAFVIVGALISWIMTRPLPGPGEAKITAPVNSAEAPSAKPSATKAAPPTAAPAPTVSKVTASKELPGQAELASGKGSWKYEKPGTTETKAAPKPSAKKPTAKKAAPAAKDGRPALLTDKPRKGGADDLKLISGVGPKLEQTLNELGVWHFDQVAAFTKADIEWVDARLRFKGRIERDDWMSQAKTLAEGGETEFSKKKSKS